jgi:cyclopropane fatty-acyl-phospholipid synthase-like methyltransferase
VATLRFNEAPAAGFVHPRMAMVEGDHDAALDLADEASPNYLQWIADLCRPHLGTSVLEVGAGIGAITERIAAGRRVLATDLSDPCVARLEDRFAGNDSVVVAKADLRTFQPQEAFDSVLMVNVLEHIQDDAGVLARLRSFLRPGGTAVVYVPALNGLYGAWDRKVGHYRRYSRWRLGEVFRAGGFEVAELRYVNMLAIPAWAAFAHSDMDATIGRSLSIWDKAAVPVIRAVESRVHAPIGLNLLGVGRTPG